VLTDATVTGRKVFADSGKNLGGTAEILFTGFRPFWDESFLFCLFLN